MSAGTQDDHTLPVFVEDEQGTVLDVNPAACRMLGFTSEEMIGQPSHALIHHHHPDGSDYPVERCPMYAAYKHGKASRIDDEFLWRKDGTGLPVVAHLRDPQFERARLDLASPTPSATTTTCVAANPACTRHTMKPPLSWWGTACRPAPVHSPSLSRPSHVISPAAGGRGSTPDPAGTARAFPAFRYTALADGLAKAISTACSAKMP